MKCTTRFTRWLLSTFAVAVITSPLTSLAQPADVEPEALQLLRRSTDYLARTNQFRVDMDATIELVYPGEQKLQYGQRIAITVQRPNRLRAERIGELISQTFYYDGKTLSVELPDQHYHASAPAPSTLEEMLDVARDKLNVIAPGSDLIYKNAFERLSQDLTSAFVVGKAIVGGVQCDQVAFRNAEVDWQIWIQDGAEPLPRKYIVTSKRMPQSPQFVVMLTKWDAAPKITDTTFEFVPPKSSHQIEFLPPAAAAAANEQKE